MHGIAYLPAWTNINLYELAVGRFVIEELCLFDKWRVVKTEELALDPTRGAVEIDDEINILY